jgi:hypothetical protein
MTLSVKNIVNAAPRRGRKKHGAEESRAVFRLKALASQGFSA